MNLIRWTLFFARTWAIPFIGGLLVGMILITWSTIDVLNSFGGAFDKSFDAVIQSCAKVAA
ncbi:hypothetical protein D3C78_1772880 [compost metagenome]